MIKTGGEKVKSLNQTVLLTNLLVRSFDCRYFKHIVLIIIKKGEIVGKSKYKSKCWSKILMMIKEAWKPSGSQYEENVLLCLKLSCKV